MKYQKLLSLTRQAVDTYQMIDEGDHIAVGISGGKDSLTLLCALYGLKRFYPKSFDLTAITVNLGFQNLEECAGHLKFPIKSWIHRLPGSFLKNAVKTTHVLCVLK